MSRSARPEFVIFLTITGITLVFWVLRGFGLFTFLPGLVLWILILLSIGSGVFAAIQRTRR